MELIKNRQYGATTLKEESRKRKLRFLLLNQQILTFLSSQDASGPKHLNITLSRSKLEQICDGLYQRTIEPFKNC